LSSELKALNRSKTPRPLYHGTKADLAPGGLLRAGYSSNYDRRKNAFWVYMTGKLDAAIWGAEFAQGGGRERIYIVEPTGPIFDDPNLTDTKFPGNPTQSFRSREPLRIIGEVSDWQPHAPAQLNEMRARIEELREQGVEAID
jgi:hypothetical protein